jgi:hypothetical protein
MWFGAFRGLADEDLAAVIVYLRSRPPVRNPLPATQLPAEVEAGLADPAPLTEPVPLPDLADPLERARYHVRIADCAGCHTSWYSPRIPGFFAGGNPIEREGGTAFSANITSDPSGIPFYDEALFRKAMRTGRVGARVLHGAMPWVVFRNLSDADLDGILRLLRDVVPPTRHEVDNLAPPTDCPACGGRHPLGEHNVEPEFHPVALDPRLAAALEGRYRFADGFEIEVSYAAGKLTAKLDGRDYELFSEDARTFRIRDQPDVIEFRRDAAGRVTGLLSSGVFAADRLP